ncbi:MAG: hypothetical protein SGI71_10650 [Verrucomicrobiota bacterium]|nr:hypothetical protein [Verrucomicrobiota bacterium]
MWQTLDAGNSWTLLGKGLRAAYLPPDQQFNPAMQDVHRLVQSPAKPDVFWVQHHNGIFISCDRAQTWKEIENVLP